MDYDTETYSGDEDKVDQKEEHTESACDQWFPMRMLENWIVNCAQSYLEHTELQIKQGQ